MRGRKQGVPREGSRRTRRGQTVRGVVGAAARRKHLYQGPMKFKGICENCGEARNRHCGCGGCRGWHTPECFQKPGGLFGDHGL